VLFRSGRRKISSFIHTPQLWHKDCYGDITTYTYIDAIYLVSDNNLTRLYTVLEFYSGV
jgi:hypothetical protein